jgi:poly-gamma-glutamate synthesis protein (capsule biosynthesis protein)
VRILAVGDILMHQDVQLSARQSQGGLRSLWSEVEPMIHGADIAFANLETPVAPVSGHPGRPFLFNAPAGLPAALKASGFTVLSTANNHAYDQGVPGVVETLQRLRAEGLVPVGSGATRPEAEQVRIVESHGLRIAFLGFTDIFNINLNRRADEPWVCPLDPAAACAAVRAARARADAVVVSLHWGVEYSHQPTARQREVAGQLAGAGADLILGAHPHALQPVEFLERAGHRTLVVYSMGNFVSNQDRMYSPDDMPVPGGDSRDGVAVQCRLVKLRLADGSERVELADAHCEPLWTLNNWSEFNTGTTRVREIRVVPVGAAIAATRERLRGGGDPASTLQRQAFLRILETRRQRALETLGQTAGGTAVQASNGR